MDSSLPTLPRLNRRLGVGLLAASTYLAGTAVWFAGGIRAEVGTGGAIEVAGALSIPVVALAMAGWLMIRMPSTGAGRVVQAVVEILAVLSTLGFIVGGIGALAGSPGWGETSYVVGEMVIWVTCGTLAARSVWMRILRGSRVPARAL